MDSRPWPAFCCTGHSYHQDQDTVLSISAHLPPCWNFNFLLVITPEEHVGRKQGKRLSQIKPKEAKNCNKTTLKARQTWTTIQCKEYLWWKMESAPLWVEVNSWLRSGFSGSHSETIHFSFANKDILRSCLLKSHKTVKSSHRVEGIWTNTNIPWEKRRHRNLKVNSINS